jgi:RNA polymerase sigma-70 factor (ECF subfamily)
VVAPVPAEDGDADLASRLRAGDSAAFALVVRQHHASLLRVAATFVPTRKDAEDVVQETWLAVIRGIGKFEGRSSLRSWIFAILVYRARSYGVRETRRLGGQLSLDAAGPTGERGVVPADRFGGPPGRGAWREPITRWQDDPELALDSVETRKAIMAAIDRLPDSRRQVVVLRDVEGWTAAEVADLLGISDANQRVLLHRARSALRLSLEEERRP